MTIKWVEFAFGPPLLEAVNAGAVDYGYTGDSPPIFAQAAKSRINYVAVIPARGYGQAIVAPEASPIRTLEDLRGKKIGVAKGSSAHNLLISALESANVAWSDITPVYLAPADAASAVGRGAIDAWSIWDPYYAAAEIDGKARVLATGQGLSSNNSFYLGSPALAGNPALVQRIFAALSEADLFVQTHRSETAKFISSATGLPLATSLRFLERRSQGPVTALDAAQVADQQRVADAFAQLGLIPRPIRVADAVAPLPAHRPGATAVHATR